MSSVIHCKCYTRAYKERLKAATGEVHRGTNLQSLSFERITDREFLLTAALRPTEQDIDRGAWAPNVTGE